MAISYPHKQTILIFIICLVAIIVVAFYVNSKNIPEIGTTIDISSKNENLIITSTSTDWKKQFLSSSPYGKNIVSAEKKVEDEPLTLTDTFGRNFLTNFITLQQAGAATDKTSVQNAIDQTLQNTFDNASSLKTYEMKDVVISNDITTIKLKNYGNIIGGALINYSTNTNAPSIADEALSTDNLDSLSKIDPIISSYKKIIDVMKSTPVPISIAQYHLNILNAINTLLYSAQGLRNIQTDPMQGMIALGVYSSAQDLMMSGMQNIHRYFLLNKIIFDPTEPGIIFFSANLQ